jgi:hypothetical protein
MFIGVRTFFYLPLTLGSCRHGACSMPNEAIPPSPGLPSRRMPAEEFFRGTTLGSRTLVLYGDEERHITGRLDGEALDIETLSWSGDSATVKTAEHGTFSATATDYAEDHSAALRRYLEHRPADGYEVTLMDRGQGTAEFGPEPEAAVVTCTVEISNGRLTERAEFRFSEQAARVLARGQESPTDEQLLRQIYAETRTSPWERIRQRAEHPSLVWRLAHPL